MTPIPLINGARYPWAEVIFPIYGQPVPGVCAVEYGSFMDSRGKIHYHAEILLEDFNEVQRLLMGKKMYELPPIDVTVSFRTNSHLVTHVLKLTEFRKHDYQNRITDILVMDIIHL